ncbi:MAG TPA: DUF192 domain-containing protein [Bryobacteraceae bacterium]|nr:DUF192 domain-containing protein [Bryobacteraceae bacterium]
MGTTTAMPKFRVRNRTRGTVLATAVEVAASSRQRRTGLLKYDSLEPGRGLWIVPSEGIHTFGMRFSIDVIFLDRRKKVVKLRPHMGPGRISVCLWAHSVLELPAGAIAATGTRLGDELEFEEASDTEQQSPAGA